MLFWEIIAVYCKKHTKHIGTRSEQNAELLDLKQVAHMVRHVHVLKGHGYPAH
jgi:hypothetical protein